MKLRVTRKGFFEDCTIGELFVDGVKFCDTMEDKDRGLSQSQPLPEIIKNKVNNHTCIPYGAYAVTLDVVSPKYSSADFYRTNASGGRLPRLKDVPGFDGILIHCGNTAGDTAGCLLIGERKTKGRIDNSRDTFLKLYPMLLKNKNNITIEFVKQ
jgi:hypothetical protein